MAASSCILEDAGIDHWHWQIMQDLGKAAIIALVISNRNFVGQLNFSCSAYKSCILTK
jgi:hypothetical protein